MGNFPSRVITRKRGNRKSDQKVPLEKALAHFPQEGSRQLSKAGSLLSKDLEPLDDTRSDYTEFLREYPQYYDTRIIDELRLRDFTRLSHNAVYLDYMGGGQYPESLVRAYAEILQNGVFGNTHSESMSSRLSEKYSQEARMAVLSFFDASPDEYTVIWTANATAGLKLVGESFPFTSGSSFILPVDAHNSVHGIRAFAMSAGASVKYVGCLEAGGFDVEEATQILQSLAESTDSGLSSRKPRSLMAITGLSNLTNCKTPLHLIVSAAHSHGIHTILDAAALAPTTQISLKSTPVDSMVVSFYKMFGFPTGVGALIAKKGFLDILERPWFAGGTVDLVQVPGIIMTPTESISSRFEEGTINYLTLPALTIGIEMLSSYMHLLPIRLSSLYHYLYTQLSTLQHPGTKTPVVKFLTAKPSPPSNHPPHGYVLSFLLLNRMGEVVPVSRVEALAAGRDQNESPVVSSAFKSNFKYPWEALPIRQDATSGGTPPFSQRSLNSRAIALRTGCACNPGGAAVLLGIESYMQLLKPGATRNALESEVGRELGVIRLSLGWVSDWSDVANFLRFVKGVQEVVG